MEINNLNLLKEKCSNLKILYVEDNEKVRQQTKKALSIYFPHITLAINGKEGLEKIKKNNIDIVFTDINMPKMDGLSMIKNIRSFDKNIYIVVFSAYDNSEYLLECIDHGVDGYILKPFKFNQIQNIIEKIIDKIYNLNQHTHSINLADSFKWNLETLTLQKNSKYIELTKNEIILIKLLSSSKHAIFSSEEIELEVFNDNYNDNKRVRGLISRLNKKIGSRIVKSKYAQGYELNLERK